MTQAFQFESAALPPAERAATPRRVLVTGAAGRIGSDFARCAAERDALTLMVREGEDASHLESYGEVVRADLAELDRLKELCAGIDTVVHLAGVPDPAATWDALLPNNIVGTYNLYVAAAHAKCRRVVFASSVHAVTGYPASVQVRPEDPVNPGDLYGVSKCFGEAMGRMMANYHNLSVIALRIGAYQSAEEMVQRPRALHAMTILATPRDVQQLLRLAVDDTRLRFAIVHAMSNNTFNALDISQTRALLGYQPVDDFTAEHAALAPLNLAQTVVSHNAERTGKSGLQDQLGELPR